MVVDGVKPTVTTEAREILRQAIPKAAKVLIKLLDATDEKLRLRASEAVLTLAGIVHVPRAAGEGGHGLLCTNATKRRPSLGGSIH